MMPLITLAAITLFSPLPLSPRLRHAAAILLILIATLIRHDALLRYFFFSIDAAIHDAIMIHYADTLHAVIDIDAFITLADAIDY